MKLSWSVFINNWQKDAKMVAFLVLLMIVFRFAMMIVFGNQLNNPSAIDYLFFITRSLQFDFRIALLWALPSFILGIFVWKPRLGLFLDKIRNVFGCVAIFVTLLLYIGDIGFFWEYHDQYNQWIYGMVHDDFFAIIQTIWKTYPIIWISLGFVTLSVLTSWLFLKWMVTDQMYPFVHCGPSKIFSLPEKQNTEFQKRSIFLKIILPCLILAVYIIGLRGSIKSRPLQRDDISITKDNFLNKLVANPYFALYYTHSDHRHLNKAAGLDFFLKGKSLNEALALIFPNHPLSSNLDDWFIQTVSTPEPITKPKHIFIIVLESQDNWPFLEEYAGLQLVPNMKKLAAEGVYIKAFVSAGTSTRTTLNALITGLPDANVFTNFQPNSKYEYATALARPFKELGYQVNLFYGGHLSWQRLGELAENQGFDNTYGREHMPLSAKGDSWGVFDEYLFDFIIDTLNASIPSVNLIMTTSNHSPYPVDLKSKGCPQIVCPETIPNLSNSITKPEILGHQWYNDYCIGQFVKKVQAKLDPALFVITGDHTSRRFYSAKPSLYECKSVPLIFYGPKVMDNFPVSTRDIAGGHLDIVATLLHWLAPKNFEFHSMGSNLFAKDGRNLGLGADVAMFSTGEVWPVQEMTKPHPAPSNLNTQDLEDRYNAFHAIGWWRIINGNQLK